MLFVWFKLFKIIILCYFFFLDKIIKILFRGSEYNSINVFNVYNNNVFNVLWIVIYFYYMFMLVLFKDFEFWVRGNEFYK